MQAQGPPQSPMMDRCRAGVQTITVLTGNRSQAIYGPVSPVRPQAKQEQIWWPTTQRQNRGECDDDHEKSPTEIIEIGVVVVGSWISRHV